MTRTRRFDSELEYRRDWARLTGSLSGLQGRGPHARASASGRIQLERSPQAVDSEVRVAAADVVESTKGRGGGLLLLAQSEPT